MNINIENPEGFLQAAFSGAASSLAGEGEPIEDALHRLDEQVTVKRPSRVELDFRGLESIDAASFRKIAEAVERLRLEVKVEILGPGPGLERLFSLIPPPPGWRFDKEAPRGASPPAPREEAKRGPAASVDPFVIDLDHERILLDSEPPRPEFDPMSEPLDLSGKEAGEGSSTRTAPEAGARGGETGETEADLRIDDDEALPESREGIGELEEDGEDGLEEILDPAEDPSPKVLYGAPNSSAPRARLHRKGTGEEVKTPPPRAPPGPPPLQAIDELSFPGRREALLKERLVASILQEDCLRARIAELESEKEAYRRHLEARGAGRGPGGDEAGEVARERSSLEATPPEGSIPSGGDPAAALDFLRGDVPRWKIIRAFARILERSRSERTVPRTGLLRAASALAAAVRRAPFAMFDLGGARAGLPPAAVAVETTAMALSMALRAKAPPERQRLLALAGLLSALGGPDPSRLPEIPRGEGALQTFVRRVQKRLFDFTEDPLDPLLEVAHVREDILVLSLIREFWQRIGPAPEGGLEPPSAAFALARGEIGGNLPSRLRRLFIESFSLFPPGTWVRLGSGEVGVAVAPGTKNPRCPLVLCLLAGDTKELHARPPRLVDTGVGGVSGIVAAVRCPISRCAAPRPIVRVRSKTFA